MMFIKQTRFGIIDMPSRKKNSPAFKARGRKSKRSPSKSRKSSRSRSRSGSPRAPGVSHLSWSAASGRRRKTCRRKLRGKDGYRTSSWVLLCKEIHCQSRKMRGTTVLYTQALKDGSKMKKAFDAKFGKSTPSKADLEVFVTEHL